MSSSSPRRLRAVAVLANDFGAETDSDKIEQLKSWGAGIETCLPQSACDQASGCTEKL